MKIHGNARLLPRQQALLCDGTATGLVCQDGVHVDGRIEAHDLSLVGAVDAGTAMTNRLRRLGHAVADAS